MNRLIRPARTPRALHRTKPDRYRGSANSGAEIIALRLRHPIGLHGVQVRLKPFGTAILQALAAPILDLGAAISAPSADEVKGDQFGESRTAEREGGHGASPSPIPDVQYRKSSENRCDLRHRGVDRQVRFESHQVALAGCRSPHRRANSWALCSLLFSRQPGDKLRFLRSKGGPTCATGGSEQANLSFLRSALVAAATPA